MIERQPSLPSWGSVWLAAVVLLAVWIAVSTIWSADETRSILEAERALVYLAAASAVLLIARTAAIPHLLGGVLAGATAISGYALGTRLFPERLGAFDPISGYRLAGPVGYWNVLGLLAAMGALLALGFGANDCRGRAAGAALVVLVPTIYFTFGRGPWIALAAGFVFAAVCDPRRVQFVVSGVGDCCGSGGRRSARFACGRSHSSRCGPRRCRARVTTSRWRSRCSPS